MATIRFISKDAMENYRKSCVLKCEKSDEQGDGDTNNECAAGCRSRSKNLKCPTDCQDNWYKQCVKDNCQKEETVICI